MNEAAEDRSEGGIGQGKAIRPPVQWMESISFNVELRAKDSVPVVSPLNRERIDYVKLDTGILDHRPVGRLARLCRDRGNRRGDRQGVVRHLSGALRGVAADRTQTGVSDELAAFVSSDIPEAPTFLNKRRPRTESNPPA